MDRWPEDGSTDVDSDVGNSSRKVPFSTLPANPDEGSASDISTKRGGVSRCRQKPEFLAGLKSDEIGVAFS